MGECNEVILQARGLCTSFQRNGRARKVFEGLSFAIRCGEIMGVLGPSGCGKTTLLNVLAGFTPADAGSVLLEDAVVQGPGPERSVVFQEDGLFPWMTVAENASFGLRGRLPKREVEPRVRDMLDLVGLSPFAGYLPSEISGGMKQRVALARVLVLEPKVLLMDEPFAALDAQTRVEMQELLLRLQARFSQTVVFVTHDVKEAVLLSDHILFMGREPEAHELFSNVLPRPRSVDDPGFQGIKKTLRGLLAR